MINSILTNAFNMVIFFFQFIYIKYICIWCVYIFMFFLAKCIIPCLNGGRCKGINKCRCPNGFRGDHCEIGRRSLTKSSCSRPCKHGVCFYNNTCLCDQGWSGKSCQHSKLILNFCIVQKNLCRT